MTSSKDPYPVWIMLPLVLWLTAIYVSLNPPLTDDVRNEVISEMVRGGNRARQIAFVAAAFISLFIVRIKQIPNAFYMMLILVLIFTLSTFWSIAPEYTIRRSARFLCFSLVLLPLTTNSYRFFLTLKTIKLFAIVICAISLVMYFQGYGVANLAGELRLQGVTLHPNALAPLALMGIVLLFYFYEDRNVGFFIALIILIVTLFLAKSRTTYVAFFLFSSSYLAMKSKNYRFLTASGILLLTIFIIIAIAFFEITEFGGRDLTFTGRTTLWKLTIQDWITHPMLGTGFGASFVPVSGSLFEKTVTHLNWATVHSHQEFLQLFNELGLLFAPIVMLIISIGLAFRSRIAVYVLVPLLPYVFLETVIFDGTVFSIMFFLLYLCGSNLGRDDYSYRRREDIH